MDEHKNTTVRSKPFPASKADSEEIMRQITECIAANLLEKYEQAEYPKHCSLCFLVDKPGGNAKRLVVHYGKLNKLTKKTFRESTEFGTSAGKSCSLPFQIQIG